MLYYTLAFLIVASIVGLWGGVAGPVAWIAKTLLCIFLIALLVPLAAGWRHRAQPIKR